LVIAAGKSATATAQLGVGENGCRRAPHALAGFPPFARSNKLPPAGETGAGRIVTEGRYAEAAAERGE
jgi:hypothetical protein